MYFYYERYNLSELRYLSSTYLLLRENCFSKWPQIKKGIYFAVNIILKSYRSGKDNSLIKIHRSSVITIGKLERNQLQLLRKLKYSFNWHIYAHIFFVTVNYGIEAL